MTPLMLLEQGALVRCPDCGTDGVRLPIVDDTAPSVLLLRARTHPDLPAVRLPYADCKAGHWLFCAVCDQWYRAHLDHAEDKGKWVWRISRCAPP